MGTSAKTRGMALLSVLALTFTLAPVNYAEARRGGSPGSLTPGNYRFGDNMPAHVAFIAKYFGKSEVVIMRNDEACSPL